MRDRALGSTIRLYFTTHAASGAAVAPSSAFVAADFRIYKDGSAAEKTTPNGITVTSPFDSLTGAHLIEIDTSNNTGDTGFFALGSAYRVVLSTAKTVDSQSVSGILVGEFSLNLQTSVATLAADQPNYAPATAANVYDQIDQWSDDRTLLTQIADIPTVAEFEARTLPSGSYFTNLGATAPAGWINAAAIASGAITSATFASGAITSATFVSGAITSTVIAANAIGASQIASNAITSAKIAANAIGASQIAADAIGASELAADAISEIQSGLMLAASYTAPDNASITAIKLKTDNLTSDPADASDIDASFSALNAKVDIIDAIVDAILIDTGTTLQAELDGIQADTEDIQARIPLALVGGRMDSYTGAMASNVLTASALAADAVTEIQAGLMLSASYVVPDNVSIAAIKTVTDALPPGDRILISTNTQREVAVTGSHHVASDVHEIQSDQLADINTQVVDALSVDTYAELSAPPAATSSLKDKITWLFMWIRNRATQTATQRQLFADNGSTVVSTETMSDDGTTFTKGEQA